MIGRSQELSTITRVLSEVRRDGQTVVVQGEAGIGKSALVAATVRSARAAGFRELRCTGVQSETTAGFAGLHEMLHPVLGLIDTLPDRQRAALATAFGLREGPEPDRLLINLAVLGLLEELAAEQPLLVVVEDLQWLDPSTRDAVTFIARRLSNAPILLLVAARATEGDVAPEPLAGVPATRIVLGPLSAEESEKLLETLPMRLDREARTKVLAEASGNPLALEEFSTAAAAATASDGTGVATLAGRLPTTRRLEQAFLGTVEALPPASRRMLLIAATAPSIGMDELFAAGGLAQVAPSDLDAAELAGLVRVTGDRLVFRHPLVRSAVYGAATTSARTRAHHALAEVATDPVRSAWHLAAATHARDEAVAAELDRAAEDARRRGAQPEAVAALERAAALSPDVTDRARRLAVAAEIARRAGATTTAVRLVEEAGPIATDGRVLVDLTATRLLLSVTAGTPGPTDADLIGLARLLGGEDGRERPRERVAVLWSAAIGAYGQASDARTRRRIQAELDTVPLCGADPYRQMASALLDPVDRAVEARGALAPLVDDLAEDMLGLQSLALASESVHDLRLAHRSWDIAVDRARRTGFRSDECQALRGRANMNLMLGRVMPALEDIERALGMVEDQDIPATEAIVTTVAARVMAWQGDLGGAAATLARSKERSAVAPLALVTADQAWAGGLIALAEGRTHSAFTELLGVSVHPVTALWAVADLTEAAVRSDHRNAVWPMVDAAASVAERTGAPHLRMLVARSRALLATDASAETHYRDALSVGEASVVPLELARTRLLYGEWLRRQRRQRDARDELSAALHAFEAAGARPFAERAVAELRAAGVVSPNAALSARSAARDRLTAQELQIARLAARGLTNREIADQVYLSHRTVSTHLYKVFPKLGITARWQLRDALAETEDGGERTPR